MINQPQTEQNKPQFSQRLDEKITLLLNKQILNTKILKSIPPKYLYEDVISHSMNDSNIKKLKMIEVGQRCKGIVVKKDESRKQLVIHLTKLVFVEPQSKYLSSKSFDKQPQEIFIHHFKQFGFMKDYDIKEPFSIFTYINSYKDIKLGSEVYGTIVRKEKRNSIVSKESQSTETNVWCEISIKNEPPKNLSTKVNLPLFGIKYDRRFHQVVDNNYQKSANFSITKLALYANNFENNDIISRLRQGLDIDLNQNINPISNIRALKHMHIDLQRIRQTQEKKWANDHYMEGLEFLKRGNNQYAIENFDVAKKFDKNNEKIHIAKGCALANMNNYSEGLKEIKEALKINPDNEQANQYYKTIREKLRNKESGPELRKKNSSHSSPKHGSKRR